MAIYVFSLLVGYLPNGVNNAQGIRNAFLKKTNQTVKYIFAELPRETDIQRYTDVGIAAEDMINVQLFLSENADLSGNYPVSEKLEEMKQIWGIDRIEKESAGINLYKEDKRVAAIFLKKDEKYFYAINYYENERLIVREVYAKRLLYTNYYASVIENGVPEAKLVRTSFLNEKGIQMFDCLYNVTGDELYVYPNGLSCTKEQMMEKFIEKLELSEKDIVFFDRPSFFCYVQPLFQSGTKAKFVPFLHSGHYYEKGEEPNALYLNYEYYYWFRNSKRINLILVSTEEQKQDLINKLKEYNCAVPRIEAVPIGGLDGLKYPEMQRKKASLITVSRLDARKRIDWVIYSVIEAHKKVPEVTLDIYGNGDGEYTGYLKELVRTNHAEDYISFKGYCNVSEVYKDYEIYVTASLWETLGLSVMEAVGSGNAVVGLNVRYGNRLFIEHEKNGELVDFCLKEANNPEYIRKVITTMADAIVKLLCDDGKRKAYQEKSYEIAERFLYEHIEKKWSEVLESI